MEYCPQCEKEVETEFFPAPEHSPHFGRIACKECRAFIGGWVPKPKNKDKRKKSKYKIEDIGIDYCEICLRTLEGLGRNEVLEIHHILEIQEGGLDELKNIMIACTACHRLIHWLRLYFNRHFKV